MCILIMMNRVIVMATTNTNVYYDTVRRFKAYVLHLLQSTTHESRPQVQPASQLMPQSPELH